MALNPAEVPTSTLTERLGKLGLWVSGAAPGAAGGPAAFARRVEAMGIGAVWVGGGNPDEQALRERRDMLAATERLVVATGILNIWAWDPAALASRLADFARNYPGRFVLGLGVSHRPQVEQLGRDYAHPLAAMRRFLDDLDRQSGADSAAPRVLAALGPNMLELARDRTAGAHPYLAPPAHSAFARQVLGAGPLLAPEQAVVMQRDPDEGRRIARQYLATYLKLPNYLSNLRRFGFDDRDFEAGGSDRLVDTEPYLILCNRSRFCSDHIEGLPAGFWC
ncbi:MAG TPA: TIGR03620 family F420-dependent LLM class oxidoreductase [Acidimicrobiales bacterium]|jgi:probable F420-dependent oxidoreductase|nr:TIGR03620 family F420-dependent LLM class oxidoreductase [Acidimicrobiales bacterium]